MQFQIFAIEIKERRRFLNRNLSEKQQQTFLHICIINFFFKNVHKNSHRNLMIASLYEAVVTSTKILIFNHNDYTIIYVCLIYTVIFQLYRSIDIYIYHGPRYRSRIFHYFSSRAPFCIIHIHRNAPTLFIPCHAKFIFISISILFIFIET